MTRALVIVCVCTLLAACPGTRSVYDLARTPPQYAKAVLLHHNAIGTQIASLNDDPTVGAITKKRLLDGYRTTVCSESEIQQATGTDKCSKGPAQKLESIAKAYERAGSRTSEEELQEAVNTLVNLLVPLITQVSGAKP